MHYASITRRFAAMVLDALIVVIPVVIFTHAVPILGGLLMLFLYYAIFESSELRATIGKNLMGIEVTDLSGGRITIRAASLRLFVKILSVAFCFIGHFFAFFTARKQALHDLATDTVVVYGRREVGIVDAWANQIKEVWAKIK